MSDLGDFLDKKLHGERPAGAAPPSRSELMAEAEAKYGSGRKAAAAFGIPESTWRRNKKNPDATPKAETAEKIERAGRDVTSRPIAKSDLKVDVSTRERTRGRHGPTTVQRHGGQRVMKSRERTIKPEQLRMADGAEKRIRDAYVEGGKEAAARQFVNEIQEPFYRDKFAAGLEYEGDGEGGDYTFTILTA